MFAAVWICEQRIKSSGRKKQMRYAMTLDIAQNLAGIETRKNHVRRTQRKQREGNYPCGVRERSRAEADRSGIPTPPVMSGHFRVSTPGFARYPDTLRQS